ncbi:MAG: glutathione S-transferase family protein [Pseudomonadota bacterium]
MKIYGHYFSSPANQVRLTASALNLEHEYIHVDLMAGEQKEPAYRAVNKFGKVPAIDDDGYQLAESGAICRYLACKSDNGLYPDDIKARGDIDQWMDFAAHHIRANMGKVLFNTVFAPAMDLPTDQKSLDEGRANLDANLPTVDAALKENAFLTGDALTIADTAMIAAMEPFEMINYDIAPYANVKRWRDAAMAQDWYQRVHAHYAAEHQL